MREHENILKLLEEKEASNFQQSQRGLIIQPGAIGDCILTLPLVKFMKERLKLGAVDILGHTEYLNIMPGRTQVDRVISMESIELHRLFVEPKSFELPDGDSLIDSFAGYSWIVTFLGHSGSDFEKNLIYTVNCSHSAEIITIPLRPPEDFKNHLSNFYTEEFCRQINLTDEAIEFDKTQQLIFAKSGDKESGETLLRKSGVEVSKELLLIHPGSGGKNKCWHIDNFLSIAKKLSKKMETIFLLGPAEEENFEKDTLQKINQNKCLRNLNLTQAAGLLTCSKYFLGNDSGISHLSAGLGIETFVLFGPTNPDIYRPFGPKVTILKSNDSNFAKKPSIKMQNILLKNFNS